ncbi:MULTISPECIES: hypothetical protein [unclassified Sphingomonas]|uniref:hypothetical protein n=1 Tax=unclassified Sphingomonas TaxID=196159 RepID=UPI0006F67800|nr:MULTISPECIES: hypothetical protein [unclassified Sphingomonas]KQX18385.1 hypothetical protein ASD17_14585 [Sphingomonas sp. Root1294]KQY72290.1 hypothetical protein ASD39_20390 [Sphingomonas sp. Root50]KRB94439.1 hypothetical protein ASE22_00360 [Sphingomonas sp. Root720]
MNAQTKLIAADGWIAHHGGPCPEPWSTMVWVRFADGSEPQHPYAAGWRAQFWTPGLDSAGRPRNTIVAYRYDVPLTDVVDMGPGRVAA